MRVKILCLLIASIMLISGFANGNPPKALSRLCVVWTSADPEVARNVCFMFTLNAKKAGWFDVVHLVVWGPSAKLLAADRALQVELSDMQKIGVVTEACVACARRYGVDGKLKELGLDVKGMGEPLSQRLKGDWKVITF